MSGPMQVTFNKLTYSNEGPPARRAKEENPPKPFRPAHVSEREEREREERERERKGERTRERERERERVCVCVRSS